MKKQENILLQSYFQNLKAISELTCGNRTICLSYKDINTYCSRKQAHFVTETDSKH